MSDISTHYGGSILVMAGKDSISLISDTRLGCSSFTVSTKRTSIFSINNKCSVALTAFLPDCQHLLKKIKKHVSLFELAENREIEPEELASLISFMLYSHRKSPLYVETIVAGINSNGATYVASMDCLGCLSTTPFAAAGTASKNLMGMAEALFSENMDEDDLFVHSIQAFLNAVDRDALSGWGAECFILGKNGSKKRTVKARND